MIKNYEVDLDSLEDCEKLIRVLRSRIGELRKNDPNHISSKERKQKIFMDCNEIFNFDISKIYCDMNFDPTRKYYVYAHCDPSRKIAIGKDGRTTFAATLGLSYFPFYFGKGTGKRAWELDRNDTHRKVRQKIKMFGDDINVKIIKEGLSELEAFMYESKLIDIFGLRTTGGFLVNLDEGIRHMERKSLYADNLQSLWKFDRERLKIKS